MKLLIINLFLLFAFLPAFAQIKTDRETAGLIGTVKSVRYGSSSPTRPKGDLFIYDRSGREISREEVSDYGEAMGKAMRTFDAKELLTDSTWTDPKGNLIGKQSFIYRDGRLAEITTYDAKGVIAEKLVKEYDASGRLETDNYQTADGKLVAKTVYKYEKGTEPVEAAFFKGDGQKATAPVGPCLGAHRVTFAYDNKGRVYKKSVFEDDGTLKKSYESTYDPGGNMVRLVVSGRSGTTTTWEYKYEFDARGNWVKRYDKSTMVTDPRFSIGSNDPYVRNETTTREITYY